MSKIPLNESSAPRALKLVGGGVKKLEERFHNDGSPVFEATGVFQNYKQINNNGRRYPLGVWQRVLAEGSEFMQKVRRRGVLGVGEHPADGRTKIFEASHVITNVWIATPQEIRESKGELQEGDVLGSYEILNTRPGKDLRALHEAKVEVGVSSRGAGSVVPMSDCEEVCADDYDLETWDIVAVPSVTRANPTPRTESTEPPTAPNSLTESVESELDTVGLSKEHLVQAGVDEADFPAFIRLGKLRESGKVTEDDLENELHGKYDSAMLRDTFLSESKDSPPTTGGFTSTPPNTTMSKQAEFRVLRNNIAGLVGTPVKGMPPTKVASLIESLQEGQIKASALASEDPTLGALAFSLCETVQKRLNEMDEEFDSADDAPIDDAPPAGEDGMDPVADAAIERAVSFLRDSEDPEAQEIADDLEDVKIAHDPGLEGDLTDTEVKALPESTQRKVIALSKRHSLLGSNYARLENVSGKLLERSIADRGKLQPLTESASRAKKVLADLTEAKANLLELAHKYTEATLPGVYKAAKAKLTEAKSLEAFETILESAIAESKKAKAPTTTKLTEARRSELRKRLEERRTASKTPTAPAAPAAVKQPLTEAHEAVGMVKRLAGRVK